MTLVPAAHRLLAAAAGGLVLGLGPVVALAQTADPELS